MDPVELLIDELVLRPWRPAGTAAVHRACQDPPAALTAQSRWAFDGVAVDRLEWRAPAGRAQTAGSGTAGRAGSTAW